MNFLNSPQWRNFQESVGRKTFDLGPPASPERGQARDGGRGEGYAIKLDIPFGKSYLYSNYIEAPKYLKEIKKLAKQENAIFFKYEPMDGHKQPAEKYKLKERGFLRSPKVLQPQKTIISDLTKNEEELMSGMHKKARYNIRLSARRGVEIGESDNIDIFWSLLAETARRDKFHTHTKDYYKKLLDLDITRLYLAQKGDELHAAALVLFYKKRAIYLHGASDYRYRRDMAPHLLHWYIMKDAKKQGFEEYDFWGIDEKKWPGVTRFKYGFGGREVEYPGSWDLPTQSFWYKLYSLKNEIFS